MPNNLSRRGFDAKPMGAKSNLLNIPVNLLGRTTNTQGIREPYGGEVQTSGGTSPTSREDQMRRGIRVTAELLETVVRLLCAKAKCAGLMGLTARPSWTPVQLLLSETKCLGA